MARTAHYGPRPFSNLPAYRSTRLKSLVVDKHACQWRNESSFKLCTAPYTKWHFSNEPHMPLRMGLRPQICFIEVSEKITQT